MKKKLISSQKAKIQVEKNLKKGALKNPINSVLHLLLATGTSELIGHNMCQEVTEMLFKKEFEELEKIKKI